MWKKRSGSDILSHNVLVRIFSKYDLKIITDGNKKSNHVHFTDNFYLFALWLFALCLFRFP